MALDRGKVPKSTDISGREPKQGVSRVRRRTERSALRAVVAGVFDYDELAISPRFTLGYFD